MMMIVGAFPDTWRSDHITAEYRENDISDFRSVKYRMVLKIVKYDEEPGEHHSGKNAAN